MRKDREKLAASAIKDFFPTYTWSIGNPPTYSWVKSFGVRNNVHFKQGRKLEAIRAIHSSVGEIKDWVKDEWIPASEGIKKSFMFNFDEIMVSPTSKRPLVGSKKGAKIAYCNPGDISEHITTVPTISAAGELSSYVTSS